MTRQLTRHEQGQMLDHPFGEIAFEQHEKRLAEEAAAKTQKGVESVVK